MEFQNDRYCPGSQFIKKPTGAKLYIESDLAGNSGVIQRGTKGITKQRRVKLWKEKA